MKQHALQMMRFGINGVVATVVHFLVLVFNLKVLALPSAGLANGIAALFGVSASFIGSRYFVFPATGESILVQAIRFSGLYAAIAILHGLILLVWTDWFGLDYRIGFLVATGIQVSLSYLGNKTLVFQP